MEVMLPLQHLNYPRKATLIPVTCVPAFSSRRGFVIAQYGWPEIRIFEQMQRCLQHSLLATGIPWRVEWVSMLERDEQGPRGPDFLSHMAQQLEDDSRNPLAFQLGGDQTHGLVAHRSDRCQQRHVHSILNQLAYGERRGLLDQAAGCGDRAHAG